MVATRAIVSREPTQPLRPNWALETVHVGPLGDEDVLVEMHAAGICHTDLLLGSLPRGALGIAYPKVAGHEGAGVIQAVGSQVRDIQVGDPVLLSFYSCSACHECQSSHPAYCDEFATGNYPGNIGSMKASDNAEPIWSQFFGQSSFSAHSVVRKSCVVNVKEQIKDIGELKLFASLGCGFQTGMGAVQNLARAVPDDVALIMGMGAVGMGALLTAKIAGCKSIIAVDRIKSRLDLATRLGASHVIDTSDPAYVKLDDAVRQIIPTGTSVVIDTTAIPAIVEQAIETTRARSRILLIGVFPPGYQLPVGVSQHMQKGRSIIGCIEGDCVPQEVSPIISQSRGNGSQHQAIPQMIQWYRDGKFPIDLLLQYFEVRADLSHHQSRNIYLPFLKAAEYEMAIAEMKNGNVIKPVLLWK
ncbi:hypothetical protein N7492_003338 [Penicillium capsulatum]|uniref:Enoyl reductase (ER) domain-containing protein n=1 Tax=Penicillium capsulatum TaxID=69766 RepID=A0A9W9LW49_9EURO|nr:hypothetical protein N7492_003338 [Penicillium capsulatum]